MAFSNNVECSLKKFYFLNESVSLFVRFVFVQTVWSAWLLIIVKHRLGSSSFKCFFNPSEGEI